MVIHCWIWNFVWSQLFVSLLFFLVLFQHCFFSSFYWKKLKVCTDLLFEDCTDFLSYFHQNSLHSEMCLTPTRVHSPLYQSPPTNPYSAPISIMSPKLVLNPYWEVLIHILMNTVWHINWNFSTFSSTMNVKFNSCSHLQPWTKPLQVLHTCGPAQYTHIQFYTSFFELYHTVQSYMLHSRERGKETKENSPRSKTHNSTVICVLLALAQVEPGSFWRLSLTHLVLWLAKISHCLWGYFLPLLHPLSTGLTLCSYKYTLTLSACYEIWDHFW